MIKEKLNLLKGLVAAKNNRWGPSDLAVYIGEYMDKHPEKKLTGHLRRKLTREYYRSLKKSQNLHSL